MNLHVETPLWFSKPLSALSGKDVYLKMDVFQPTGSFKTRGIGYLCQQYHAEGLTHIVASSGGNAGYAAAYAARRLGMSATIYVPEGTLEIFIERLKGEGAEVRFHGTNYDEASEAAIAYAEEVSGGYVSPYDHPHIWEGHTSVITECVGKMEMPDAVIASVGGGGLMAGILDGIERSEWSGVHAIGVEVEGANALEASLKAGEQVVLDQVDTIAKSIASKRVTQGLLDRIEGYERFTVGKVSDAQAVEAARRFLDDHRVLVEPACGAALAPIYDNMAEIRDAERILVIVCGGIGISYDILKTLLNE